MRETSVVVNCVEHNKLAVTQLCLAHSVHYAEVSATVQILRQLEALQVEAERTNATAVLNVGVAPGLTNLLAHHAQSRLGPLARADLFVLLGLGEVHGEAAIRWLLQNLGQRFAIVAGGVRQEVRFFTKGLSTIMPQSFGRRTAFLVTSLASTRFRLRWESGLCTPGYASIPVWRPAFFGCCQSCA